MISGKDWVKNIVHQTLENLHVTSHSLPGFQQTTTDQFWCKMLHKESFQCREDVIVPKISIKINALNEDASCHVCIPQSHTNWHSSVPSLLELVQNICVLSSIESSHQGISQEKKRLILLSNFFRWQVPNMVAIHRIRTLDFQTSKHRLTLYQIIRDCTNEAVSTRKVEPCQFHPNINALFLPLINVGFSSFVLIICAPLSLLLS